MTTLTDGTTTVTLPDSMQWVDEFDFSPVTQDIQRTIGGGFIVQEGALSYGQPVTLQGGENVWTTREVIKQIQTLASVPNKALVLTLADGRTFNVIFRRDSGNPFSAVPLWRKDITVDADRMKRIVLRFYTIQGES
tara:strand:+ start:9013 stop:9420 length:408 start_codon:yes stop_codon:yes gene_type:complete